MSAMCLHSPCAFPGHAKLELAHASETQTHQYMIMELLGGWVVG